MSNSSVEERIKILEQHLVKTIDLSEKMFAELEDVIDNIHNDILELWKKTPGLTGVFAPDSTPIQETPVKEIHESLYKLKREIESLYE